MKKKYLGIGILFIIFTMLISACSNQVTTTTQEEEVVIPVQVAKAIKGELKEGKKIIGNSAPNLDLSIYSEVSGKIAEVRVKKGDLVKKDQVLVVIEQGDYKNAVSQAEAQVKSAEANLAQAEAGRSSSIVQANNQLTQSQAAYDDAKLNLERMKSLFEQEAVSKQQLEQAESALVQAESALNIAKESSENANRIESVEVLRAQVETAKIGLMSSKSNLDKTVIKAPADGTVVQIGADVGELISPQLPTVTLIDIQSINVNAMISEEDLRFVRQGETIAAYIKAIDQKTTGTVSYVSPIADQQTKNYPIEVTLQNTDLAIKPGMIVELYLQATAQGEDVLVPVDALVKQDEEVFIFVVNGDKAEKRQVTIKEEGSEEASVAKGLNGSETVVVKGQMNLKDGDKIRIVQGGSNG